MNYSEYIIKTLEINEIDTYFIITGGAIVPFINYLSKNKKKYYCFQHEQSAAMAAEGYFRASGKIACVVVTSGPGVQNVMNGLCGCWYDSIPALFITGQVNTNESLDNIDSKPRQSGFQEMPVVECFKYFTTASKKISEVCKIDDIITELKTPRYGPVLIDLPVNIQQQSCDFEPVRVYSKIINPPGACIDFSESERPLVIIGAGVKLSHREKECIKFLETNKLPFVVSWGAFDVCSTDHPLRIGSHGVYGDRIANYAVQNADLLVILGSRLDSRQTGGNFKSFSKFSRKIMVDIDGEEINKLYERGITIHSKIITPLETFFDNVSVSNIGSEYTCWKEQLHKCKYIFTDPERTGVYNILPDLFKKFPDNSIIIPDQGGNLVWTMQTATLTENQSLFTNLGNSSMGFALPCAIGAAIGSERPIVCIDGDGGFQMNIQELLTVSKYKLPIDIYILNNSGYGIIKQFQDNYFSSNYVATTKQEVFGEIDIPFEEIAKCYGVHTLRDVKIPENQKIFPKLEFGNSLENMSPYLDHMEEHMIVDWCPSKHIKGEWS